MSDTGDYKQVFTDDISDRIKKRYRQKKARTNFRKCIEKLLEL